MGLPSDNGLDLDPVSVESQETLARSRNALRRQTASHPEILEARAEVEKTEAAVRWPRRYLGPRCGGFGRYSYQNNVPFLARHISGTFGIHLGMTCSTAGASERERNVNRIGSSEGEPGEATDEVELPSTLLQQTRKDGADAEGVGKSCGLCAPSRTACCSKNSARSRAEIASCMAAAQEYDAKTLLLQSH